MVEIGFFVQQDNRISESINQSVGPAFYQKGASIAEMIRYDSFWLPDHWLLAKNRAALDCWSVLTAAAANTQRIKIGSLVTPVTAHSPFLLAKKALTLQMISKGRLQFGLGAGWHRQEYLASGLPFDRHRIRLEKLEEAIQLILRLWKAESPFDFNGKYFTAIQALLMPHIDPPSLWLGGASDKLLNLTAKYANGWIGFEIRCNDLAEKVEYLHDKLEREGRKTSELSIGHATRVVAAKTSREALDISDRLGLTSDYTAPDLPKALQGHLLIGSFEECATELAGYVDAGTQHLILSPQPPDRTHELLDTYKDEIVQKIR
jgi:alkanesulfonate monooxygenase SsuD/methylene tetrahydromethanopterin reductase-like flavin-dependent oxidoreductase (luciferase family)